MICLRGLLCPSAFLSAPSQRTGLGAAAAAAALAPAAPALAGEPPSVGIHWYWDLGIGTLHGEVAVVIFWVFFVLLVFAVAGAGGVTAALGSLTWPILLKLLTLQQLAELARANASMWCAGAEQEVMVNELRASFPEDGRRLLVPTSGSSRPSSRASTPSKGIPWGTPRNTKTLRAALALPSCGPAVTPRGQAPIREAPPTPRLGSEASEELATSISVMDVAGPEALVSIMKAPAPAPTADQGRQAVSDLFAWMRPLRRGNYAKGLTRLAFEIEERSQEWNAYLGGRCSRKESLDAITGEAVPPKDFSTTSEAASLILRLVRALPQGFALRTMLEPLLQELLEAIFCEWPRTLPSLQDLKEEEVWPERLSQLSTYAQLVSGYRASLEESKAAQKLSEEREQAASATAKVKTKAWEDLRIQIRRLEDERDKCRAEMQVAKRGCQEAEELYDTFKQQTKLALIDYSDMQYREATIKADVVALNVLCREKDFTIQELRNQATLLTQETQNLEEKLLKAREELERQAAEVEQLPVLNDKLQYYESEEAVLGVAFAKRVAVEVLGRSLEDIVGRLPNHLAMDRKTSMTLDAVMEALRVAHREAEKLKEQVVKLRHLLEDVKQLVPIWNDGVMQDVVDAYDEDAAIHRQIYSMSDKRSFAGLGMDESVPPYLRAEGLVRHRYISKKECEDLIESFLAEAPQDLNTESMHTELYQHMQRQFPDAAEMTEFAYAFICSLEAYRDDPDFELFDLMLAGAVHPSIMQDQETMLRELQNLVHNCADGSFESSTTHGRGQRSTLTGSKSSGRDQVSRRMMRAVMQAMFPEKSLERMNALMRALHVTMQMLFDAGRSANPDTAYVSDLFSATADGTQSPLIEEMRRQHLHEVLEFTALISQNLIRAAGGETQVNLSGRLDAFILITREAASQTLQEMGLPDTKTLTMLEHIWKPSEDGHELQVAEVLQRLRHFVLLKRESTWVLAGTKAVVEKAVGLGPSGGSREAGKQRCHARGPLYGGEEGQAASLFCLQDDSADTAEG
ncbi:Tsnaxip1 [Symbiodinium natans]|uniref:Tsnaxip1 protein n=1 Tax=Symbiodinium natans TaxID=878477 RepID=A0A812KV62_9DINO|nr:Tsnaxip1 [Symbiodinium natans]